MNIYPEILVQKTYKNRRKPGLNLNYLQTEPITEAKNTYLLRHKLLNMNKNDNLNKYKSFYFDKAINNYITPNENYYDESYNSQIIEIFMDIIIILLIKIIIIQLILQARKIPSVKSIIIIIIIIHTKILQTI